MIRSQTRAVTGETELDVEYAHTMAPGANILLVETPTSEEEGTTGFPQLHLTATGRPARPASVWNDTYNIATNEYIVGDELINSYLYRLLAQHKRGIADITTGNNTVSFTQGGKLRTVHGFNAVPGYDLASGVGTVDARYFAFELAAAARR